MSVTISTTTVCIMSCDFCSGPLSNQKITDRTKTGAIRLARMYGWSISTSVKCPQCSGRKVSDKIKAMQEREIELRKLREDAFINVVFPWNEKAPCEIEFCANRFDDVTVMGHEVVRPQVDFICTDCLKSHSSRSHFVIDDSERLIHQGTPEYDQFLFKYEKA